MEKFIFFTDSKRNKHTNSRAGETKFGEQLQIVSSFDHLKNTKAQYIIFGIPEDVGIQGNFGKPGAAYTWDSFLDAFLNIQANQYNNPNNCLILGQVDCSSFMEQAAEITQDKDKSEQDLGYTVNQLDQIIAPIVKEIVFMGKTPIIIGGGHNNAYGNIKGTSEALRQTINALNIDAHTDLRQTDYRHSGNGFSFAKKDGFLNKYAMFGIHKNYTPQYIFDQCTKDDSMLIDLFEDLISHPLAQKLKRFENQRLFLNNSYALEIDCDAIKDFPSSAMTPSGFSIRSIRNFIRETKNDEIHYLHLCEAVAKDNTQIGKALSYFVSDFIR